MTMTQARTVGLLFLLMGSGLFLWIGLAFEHSSAVAMVDFKTVFCGARALIEHHDPYSSEELERIYLDQTGGRPTDPVQIKLAVERYIYPPSAFILTVPFALLPWETAHVLWVTVTGAILILAAFSMWSVAASRTPIVAALLVGLLLVTSELLIEVGNAAGIAISLCVIAVWCFQKNRLVPAGVLCLAVSLLVKPHDSALVWFYFLLRNRKWALQTVLVAAVLAFPFILWVSIVSPHWLHEMNANLAAHSLHGGDSDPGPEGVIPWTHGAQLISLQTVFSVFWDDPRFYNPASYLTCAVLLVIWTLAVLRSPGGRERAWLALASAAALSMLPTYHRQQDTRLLLLIMPAFALVWVELGRIRWLALGFTAAGVFFTGDISLQLLGVLAHQLDASTANLAGRILTLVFARPAPLALFAVCVFYLWVIKQRGRSPNSIDASLPSEADGKPRIGMPAMRPLIQI